MKYLPNFFFISWFENLLNAFSVHLLTYGYVLMNGNLVAILSFFFAPSYKIDYRRVIPTPSLFPRCDAFGKAGQNPDSATRAMATASEVSCHGGEEAFVRAIIRDSLRLKQKVRLSCHEIHRYVLWCSTAECMLPGVLT